MGTKTYSNEVVTLWYRPPDVLLGSTVEDELHLIFKVLGTPSEENWPGISMSEELQNYNFPLYPAEPLVKRAPRLDSEGIDLVSKFLLFEARKRVSAKDAMHHSYFASM